MRSPKGLEQLKVIRERLKNARLDDTYGESTPSALSAWNWIT
ncbi:hypothetical protein ACLBR5_23610 [Escherichia coli]